MRFFQPCENSRNHCGHNLGTIMSSHTYVVAGNGASLACAPAQSILASDTIIRTNNFFFEPQSFLGPRVDLAVMGGDPRVAPFMFETLWRCRHTYDLRAWTSHNPAVIRAGQRRFATLYQPMHWGCDALADQVQTLIAEYDCKPMTGTYGVLAALGHSLAAGTGISQIILTGVDLYSNGRRYIFEAGRNHNALLGGNLDWRGLDTGQHNMELDLKILALVQEHTNGALRRTTSGSGLDEIMEMAQQRQGAVPEIRPTTPPTDWVSRVGLYPIAALKMMRWLRRVMKPRA